MPRIPTFFATCTCSLLTSFEANKTFTVKTDTKRILWLPRDNTKRQKVGPRSWATSLAAPNSLGHCSGTVRERLGLGSETLLPVPAPFGMLGASQDCSWDGSWATRTNHKCVLERFPNGFERPKLPTMEFLSVLGPFWSLVGCFASCFFRAFHRSLDRTFICSFDLSVTRSLRRRFIYVVYIQVPPSTYMIRYIQKQQKQQHQQHLQQQL